jgi:hypothetical protein
MRTPVLAALLVLAGGLAFAGAPAAKPGTSPAAKPTASAKPTAAPEPGKDECSGVSPTDGSVLATASASDYQGCLRAIREGVQKKCDGTAKQIPFVFHRGGQKPITTAAVCN